MPAPGTSGGNEKQSSRGWNGISSAIGFATIWAVLIVSLVALELALSRQGVTERTIAVVILFALGAFSGALFARGLAAITGWLRPQPSARFAIMLFGLTTGTVGMTALFHFLHFRSFYSRWHSEIFTKHWLIEFLMTGASAAYIFTVESALLLLPWGLPLLFAAAWAFAAAPVQRKP